MHLTKTCTKKKRKGYLTMQQWLTWATTVVPQMSPPPSVKNAMVAQKSGTVPVANHCCTSDWYSYVPGIQPRITGLVR